MLLKIDKDDRLYAEFFRWKTNYRVIHDHQAIARKSFCQLCQTLHQDVDLRAQVYDHFDDWWDREIHCHNSGMFVVPFNSFSFHDVNVSDYRPRKLSKNNSNHRINDLK